MLQQHVIARVELDELRAGNFRCQKTALGKGRDRVVARVQDQRGRPNFSEEPVMSVSARARRSVPASSGEVVFRHSSLNQRSCSSVPSGMNRDVNTCRNAGLSLPHELAMYGDRLVEPRGLAVAASQSAAREAAVQHHPRDALGMPHGVGNAHRRAVRDAEQHKRIRQTSRLDDRLEIQHAPIERQVARRPSRSSRSRARRSARNGNGA